MEGSVYSENEARSPMNPHTVATDRSRALHAAVAKRLGDGALIRARARVTAWRTNGTVDPRYVTAWADVLELAEDEVARKLIEQSERMDDLRQVSPFAGALDPRERWQILRSLRR
jgi:hypothetical protein